LTTKLCGQCFRPEEDCGSEDPLEGRYESAVFLSTFVHAEGFQHLGRGLEADRLTLLAHGKGCEKDRHNSILPVRDPVVGMPGDLEDELPVPALEN
jgi:hypothetical protein